MIQNRFHSRDHKKPIYLRQRFSHNSSLQHKEPTDEHFYSSKNFNKENLFSLEESGLDESEEEIFNSFEELIEESTNKNLSSLEESGKTVSWINK